MADLSSDSRSDLSRRSSSVSSLATSFNTATITTPQKCLGPLLRRDMKTKVVIPSGTTTTTTTTTTTARMHISNCSVKQRFIAVRSVDKNPCIKLKDDDGRKDLVVPLSRTGYFDVPIVVTNACKAGTVQKLLIEVKPKESENPIKSKSGWAGLSSEQIKVQIGETKKKKNKRHHSSEGEDSRKGKKLQKLTEEVAAVKNELAQTKEEVEDLRDVLKTERKKGAKLQKIVDDVTAALSLAAKTNKELPLCRFDGK